MRALSLGDVPSVELARDLFGLRPPAAAVEPRARRGRPGGPRRRDDEAAHQCRRDGGARTEPRAVPCGDPAMSAPGPIRRSEEHTSELPSLMRNSSAVFCLKIKHQQTSTIIRYIS